jgi:PhoH-like ATPase
VTADHPRTFVLDTSVLLADPRALLRFDEHEVVLPVVVITELEGKRAHPELGYFARQALRILDDLRLEHGRLDQPLRVGDLGGTVRVELNHTDPMGLPPGFRLLDNDSRILAVARNLAAEGAQVTLVSKDLPMRVKASSVGLKAEDYRGKVAVESGFTGMVELAVGGEVLDRLYEDEVVDVDEARELPCHTGLVLMSERGSALGRVTPGKSRARASSAPAGRRPGAGTSLSRDPAIPIRRLPSGSDGRRPPAGGRCPSGRWRPLRC